MAQVPYRRLPPIGEVVQGAVSPFVVASAEEGKGRGLGDPGNPMKKKEKPPPYVGAPRGHSPSSRLGYSHSQIGGWLNEQRRGNPGIGQCQKHQSDAETRLVENNDPTLIEIGQRVSRVEEKSRLDGSEVEHYPVHD